MNLTINIFKNQEINPAFVKGNTSIVSDNLGKFQSSSEQEMLLKNLWKTKHKCDLDIEKATLTFDDYQSMMVFMLKNSSA
jgi:hypothetical protein